MHDVISKSRQDEARFHRGNRSGDIHEMDLNTPSSASGETFSIFRKASCSCGGGCPACEAKSSGLKVSQPHDAAEVEADQMADKVMRMPETGVAGLGANGGGVNPKQSAGEADIQPKHTSNFGGAPVSREAASRSNSSRGSGSGLDGQTRSFFEPRFGTSLSDVRIHTGHEAAQLNRQLSAKAFTIGSDIYFGAGEYRPDTKSGKHLIAHEVAHALQQDSRTISRKAIPDDLKLPCKWGDYSLEDNKIGDIRILVAMATADRKSLPPLADIAAQIQKDNKTIPDVKFQVKTCIFAYTTTRFALYQGEPVLMIEPVKDYANVETVSHEMGHAVYHYLSHNKTEKVNRTIKSEDWIINLADIFLQLRSITLNAGTPDEITANWLVDPSMWNPGAKKEHPTDMDEFHSSAKAAYQHNKKALKDVFTKYGKQDKNLPELGKRLLALLDFLYSGSKLTLPKKMGSTAADIETHIKGIGEPSNIEDTLSSGLNTILRKLLDPADRKNCK